MKYTDPDKAAKYSAGAFDYPDVTKKAIVEMNRQVGDLKIDQRGIALRGLIIRQLVMPNRAAGTEAFVRWVARDLPKSTYVNIMAQYHVDYKAYDYPEIARGITAAGIPGSHELGRGLRIDPSRSALTGDKKHFPETIKLTLGTS